MREAREAREKLLLSERRLDIGYDKALTLVKHLEAKVLAFAPDVLVAVLRSGAIPALMLSQRIERPVLFCACNRGDEQATMLQPVSLLGKRALIVDDFSSTGSSLRRVRHHVASLGAEVKTLALFYDAGLADPPDFGYRAEHFIQFVWDRLEVTPSSRDLFAEKDSRYAPGEVSDFCGYDLDAALAASNIDISRQGAVLITSKSPQEYADMCKLDSLADLPHAGVHCRDPQEYGTSFDELTRYKADAIRKLGVSKFYEGDLQQAVHIAGRYPVVDVIWQQKGRQLRISVDEVEETPCPS